LSSAHRLSVETLTFGRDVAAASHHRALKLSSGRLTILLPAFLALEFNSRKDEIGTVLTVPKIRMVDTLVYNGLAPIWLFVEPRGRVRVHRAYKGAQYRKSQPRIAYDLWERVSPMGFPSLDQDPLFQKATERAIERNHEYFHEQTQIADAKRARRLGLPRTEGTIPSGENVPERAVSAVCVRAGCGYSWRPRSGTGGRCPRCHSYRRSNPVSGSATSLSSAT
jgi:hypothetical protein